VVDFSGCSMDAPSSWPLSLSQLLLGATSVGTLEW
jgi:hypothetical protein